jgi:hypothetical protein
MNKYQNEGPMEEILLLMIFFGINNELKVDVEILQIMHYMVCYEKLISFAILK